MLIITLLVVLTIMIAGASAGVVGKASAYSIAIPYGCQFESDPLLI